MTEKTNYSFKQALIFILKRAWTFFIPIFLAAIISVASIFACFSISVIITAVKPSIYQSSSSMLIIVDEGSTTQNFSAGQQIINNTPAVIKENVFCERVAKMLNNSTEKDNQNGKTDTFFEFLISNPSLVSELGGNMVFDYEFTIFNNGKHITADAIRSAIFVTTFENTFTVTAITKNPKLSAIIANAVTTVYEEYVKDEIVPKGTYVSTTIYQNGNVPQKPSNKNYGNIILNSFKISIIIDCALFISALFFDFIILAILLLFYFLLPPKNKKQRQK